MGKTLTSLMILALLLVNAVCHGQGSHIVSDARPELIGDKLHIYYDILNSQPSDRFDVSLSITDDAGNAIRASSVTGDIGENIAGGNNKLIIWDIIADHVEVDFDIVVIAEAPEVNESGKSFSRSGLILQSLVVPGLGMTRLTGDPHWIRGAVAYSCLAGSIVLNKLAIDTYSDFQNANSIDEANSLLEKSTQQDNISEVLAYTALGIWIVDFVWTLVGTSDLKKQSAARSSRGISIGTGFDSYSNAPLLAFTYNF